MLRAMAGDATPFFDDARQRAAGWLAAWDGQGIHRTATTGDNAGADWLAREAAALGAAVTIEEFALDRLDPVTAFLEIGGERIDGAPVFDAPATDAAGIAGRLGPAGGDAEIVVAELSLGASASAVANASGCAAPPGIAALWCCAPARTPVWGRSTPRASGNPMAPRRSMSQARRAKRCAPRWRNAPRPGWSARAADSLPLAATWSLRSPVPIEAARRWS